MAFIPCRLVCALLVVFAAGKGSEALCTQEEMTAIFSCIIPHNQEFFDAIGTGSVCNRTRISTDICRSFGEIAACIKGKNLSAQTCLPTAPAQINPNLGIPCKVEDFSAVCTDVTPFWLVDSTSSTPEPTTTTTTGDDSSGCGGRSVTQFLWMTSMMTTFLVVMAATDSR